MGRSGARAVRRSCADFARAFTTGELKDEPALRKRTAELRDAGECLAFSEFLQQIDG